ncbi:MAG TPA: hemolysin family protein [Thermomicrobiales bacterium]|nr:hemolysin family protein [Thermomicrobiales bacterium]
MERGGFVATPPMGDSLGAHLARLLGLAALIGLNGFFVAAEYALVTARKTRIDQLANAGSARARMVQRASARINTFIAATQIGVTMASLALGYVGEPVVGALLEPALDRVMPRQGAIITSHVVALILSFAIVTALEIVLGELVPKNIALQRSEGTALWVIAPMSVFMRIFRPVVLALRWLASLVVRAIGLPAVDELSSVHSVEELELLIHSTREAGLLEEQQERMVAGVFDFAEREASQVMTPRTEIEAVPLTIGLPELARVAAHGRHSRLPLYEQDLDHIVGAVHAKDVLRVLEEGTTAPETFDVRALARTVPFVPESLPLDELMAALRRERAHLAVVIDEYGGTAGIVTLDDLLEEIVGDVGDDERQREAIELLPDGSASLDGLLPIEEVNERFALGIDEPFYDTLGGYVFGQLGRVVVPGDEVPLPDGRTLRVQELDGLRVSRLLLVPAAESRVGS